MGSTHRGVEGSWSRHFFASPKSTRRGSHTQRFLLRDGSLLALRLRILETQPLIELRPAAVAQVDDLVNRALSEPTRTRRRVEGPPNCWLHDAGGTLSGAAANSLPASQLSCLPGEFRSRIRPL